MLADLQPPYPVSAALPLLHLTNTDQASKGKPTNLVQQNCCSICSSVRQHSIELFTVGQPQSQISTNVELHARRQHIDC